MMLPGDEERRYLARTAIQHALVIVLDVLDATDPGTHGDTDAVSIFFRDFESGMLDSMLACGDAIVIERVVLAHILGRHVVRRVEVANDAGNPRAERGRVEVLDELDA